MTARRQFACRALAYLAEIPRLKQADQPQQSSTKASTRHVAYGWPRAPWHAWRGATGGKVRKMNIQNGRCPAGQVPGRERGPWYPGSEIHQARELPGGTARARCRVTRAAAGSWLECARNGPAAPGGRQTERRKAGAGKQGTV